MKQLFKKISALAILLVPPWMLSGQETLSLDGAWSFWIPDCAESASLPAAVRQPQPVYSEINERVLRYADVILLLAESYLRKGSPDYSKAVSYLNMIRERANLNPYGGALNYQEVFDDLEHQRAIEFFVEGQRFYDLRRWGLLEKRLSEAGNEARYKQYLSGKSGDGNKYDYLPIPTGEITTNLLCKQDPYWEN